MTGAELRQHRERLGYYQTELAEILGLHSVTISIWERGKRKVPTTVALLLPTLPPRPERHAVTVAAPH